MPHLSKVYLSVAVLLAICGYFAYSDHEPVQILTSATPTAIFSASTLPKEASLGSPISEAGERVTKKAFGLYVSPNNSPVSPEKFTGYHTGVDFEAFSEESEIDVPIYAICDGPLLEKRLAAGYGGLLVQRCQLDDSPITVVYGHIRLTSVNASVGQQLTRGTQIAILGKAYSAETDGERKHLHLGIHKGASANIRGYVSSASQLVDWINLMDYLK